MTPGPTLDELIATVRTDATSDDPLDQLAAAARTAADLEEIADAALSHFVDQCRRSGLSWTDISKALGVTKQAAHKRFSFPPRTLERFTPRARALLPQAAAKALRFGHNYVGTEHLLLALFTDQESVAAKVLADAKISEQKVEAFVLQATPRGSSTDDAPPLTPLATRTIEKAVSEALQLGHNYVGTEHLLLALFGDTEALAAQVLAQTGATYDDLRRSIINKLVGLTTTTIRQ
jgi:hypothetical protein